MMVEDHQIASGFPKKLNLGSGVGSAVDGHHEARELFTKAARDARLAESISLGGALRNKALHVSSGGLEIAAENGKRGDAVDIVVAVKCDPFAGGYGGDQTLRGRGYSGNLLGILQRGEARVEEE